MLEIIKCRCCGHDGFDYMEDGWHCDNCDYIEIPVNEKILTDDWYIAHNISPITGLPYWRDDNNMVPTRIIKNRIHEFEGTELNQLLMFLYTTWIEHYDSELHILKNYNDEQKMEKFSEWLEKIILGDGDTQEEYKYNSILFKQLELLNIEWEKIKSKC